MEYGKSRDTRTPNAGLYVTLGSAFSWPAKTVLTLNLFLAETDAAATDDHGFVGLGCRSLSVPRGDSYEPFEIR